jgi:hypothetical protein
VKCEDSGTGRRTRARQDPFLGLWHLRSIQGILALGTDTGREEPRVHAVNPQRLKKPHQGQGRKYVQLPSIRVSSFSARKWSQSLSGPPAVSRHQRQTHCSPKSHSP